MQENNRKALLRISNLKQYFPLKGSKLFVKANDGVTLDIYEGETLGLVGESGCGKSTLGRTLLQLYRQTDGRTMYYGQSLNDVAPKYIEKTLKKLPALRKQMHVLEQKRDQLEKQYAAAAEGKEKYQLFNELEAARKAAHDAFLDIANIIGGFIKVDDLSPVMAAFLEHYKHSAAYCKTSRELKLAQLDVDDARFARDQKAEAGESTASLDKKIAGYEQKVKDVEAELAKVTKELEASETKIEEMRVPYANDEEFQRLDGFRDEGIDLARLEYNEIRLLRSDLQMIFQDPYSSLNPRMTVGQIIAEGMLAHKQFKRNDERLQQAVIKTMDDAGLQAYFIHRYPHQFSGGQRQRIGIARSLAVQPKFVVCDEAVSALDVSIQSQIINLLKDLKEQQNLTYLFITHDLSVVKYISDRIGVMYLGNIVELADSQELFDNPLHPYTEALMNAIPTTDVHQEKEIQILEGDIPSPVNPPKGCKFHTRCKYCTEICKHQEPQWVEARPNHYVACHHMLGNEEAAE